MYPLPNGLRHLCLLDGKGGLATFDASRFETWRSAEGALWLHLDLTEPAVGKWLRSNLDIPPVAVEALLTVDSRPRLTRIGEGGLLALRGVNLNEGAVPDDMVGIRIWVEENRIVTTFRRDLRSVDDIVQNLRDGEGPRSAGEVLVALAGRLVTRMSDTVDNLEEQIADLEAQVIEETNRDTRFALSNLRRQLIALRRHLAPQREALASLIVSKFSWLDEDQRLSLRETSDRLMRHLEDLDAIRERAAVTQEELQSRLAEEQNVRMYVLSIVAAVFLPLGFLTGLLGINVGGIPGSDNPAAFAIFVAILFGLVGLQVFYFRTRKWF